MGFDGENFILKTLSMSPLLFEIRNFLTKSECDYIQKVSEPHMRKSGVSLMDSDKGKEATEWRTSSTYFLRTGNDRKIKAIDERVSKITALPVDHQEDVQVLRYALGERYDTHHDYFDRRYYSDPQTLRHIQNGKRN